LKNIEFENFFQANTQIKLFFERVFDEFISPIKKNNLVRVMMNHDSFTKAINTPFMKRKEMSRDRQKSHTFSLAVITLPKYIIKGGNNPRKRGRPCLNIEKNKRICKEKQEIISMNDFVEASRYAINIHNDDKFCLLRAFFIGKAFIRIKMRKI
jgi:hypothetical protein